MQEFRADETVRAFASLHAKQNTDMSEVARDEKYHPMPVFTNPWKEDTVFTSLSTGTEATIEVSDDLLPAKSKGKQAANDFAVSCCSSKPTLDYFDTLKKAKLKSFKDLKAVCKVCNRI